MQKGEHTFFYINAEASVKWSYGIVSKIFEHKKLALLCTYLLQARKQIQHLNECVCLLLTRWHSLLNPNSRILLDAHQILYTSVGDKLFKFFSLFFSNLEQFCSILWFLQLLLYTIPARSSGQFGRFVSFGTRRLLNLPKKVVQCHEISIAVKKNPLQNTQFYKVHVVSGFTICTIHLQNKKKHCFHFQLRCYIQLIRRYVILLTSQKNSRVDFISNCV